MAVLGPRALEDLRFVTGIDPTEVLRFSMQEGMTPQEVMSFAETTIGEENEALAARYANITVRTTMPNATIYRQGASSRQMTPEKTQFANTPPVRSDEIGHMVPLKAFQDAVAWSEDWLKRAIREMVRNDLYEIRDRFRNRFDFDFWTRVLTSTENLIGTIGYDVGWAIGTGLNVNFIPPAWGNTTFDSTHTHYKRVNGTFNASNAEVALNTAALDLAHHGHTGRKVAYVSQTDIATYLAITPANVVRLLSTGQQAVTGGSSALIVTQGTLEGVPGEPFMVFLSAYGEIELRWHERIPTGYLWMTKPYGANDAKNAVAVRIDNVPGSGFGLRPNPQMDKSIQPRLESIRFEGAHGVGVNDRTNGVAVYVASGGTTYTNPTIS